MKKSILDFIQTEVKARKGTIAQFIEDSGIGGSRSGFYRVMSEPRRLGEADVERISELLGLDSAKGQELRHIISQSASGYTNKQQKDILDVVFGRAASASDTPPREVEFFSQQLDSEGGGPMAVRAAIATYADILGGMDLTECADIRLEVKNCLSVSAQKSLCALFSELRTRLAGTGARVCVEHALTVGDIGGADKIALLMGVAQMMRFRDYSVYLLGEQLADVAGGERAARAAWGFLDNTVTLRLAADRRADAGHAGDVGDSGPREKHYIFHLSSMKGERDCCLETTESIYGYFHAMFNRLKANAKREGSYTTVSASKINSELAAQGKSKKLLIKGDPCFDNISPEIWAAHMRYCGGLDDSFLDGLRSQFDPDGLDGHLNAESFLHKQVGLLAARYEDNIRMGAINIFDIKRFSDFVDNGQTAECSGAPGQQGMPPLGKELLQRQLLFMYKTVHENYGIDGAQQFYFASLGAASVLYVNVFEEEGIFLQNENNEDFVNASLVFNDSQTARLMYIVIAKSLPNSFVLSKGESLDFLRELFIERAGGTQAELDACLCDSGVTVRFSQDAPAPPDTAMPSVTKK
jgi:hypothetical protein